MSGYSGIRGDLVRRGETMRGMAERQEIKNDFSN